MSSSGCSTHGRPSHSPSSKASVALKPQTGAMTSLPTSSILSQLVPPPPCASALTLPPSAKSLNADEVAEDLDARLSEDFCLEAEDGSSDQVHTPPLLLLTPLLLTPPPFSSLPPPPPHPPSLFR
jgi:hypothetical protein